MKSKVHFSPFCRIITVAVIALFLIGIIANRNHTDKSIVLIIIACIIIFTSLYYCPVSISIDVNALNINRLLSGSKTFKFADIEAVDTCYPSAGAIRLCGSGGFFGYWGYFSDILIGKYFGYYADRGQCFYIRLKNKKQYVISCADYIEIVNAIRKKIE